MSADRRRPRIWSERRCKWLLNLYPPFLFNRIRIAEIRQGFRFCRVHVHRSFLTRNLQGSTFGGTIYSAADPIYAILYWQIMAHRGLRVQAWLKSGSVAYMKPASTRLTLDFKISDDDIENAVNALERDGRHAHTYRTKAIDRDNDTCAVIETEIYLRTPRKDQQEVSAF